MIRIGEILESQHLMLDLSGASKAEVLRRMTECLAAVGSIADCDEIYRRLMERESLMTTGVKRGFAFPHAFSEQIAESFVALGRVRGGVDYESLDGNPVEFIFLLLGPPSHQSVHLRILARISRLMGQPDILEKLHGAETPADVMELLGETERNMTLHLSETSHA